MRPELLLAYVSSQLAKADAQLDHVLENWKEAGLLKPSFVRPKIAAIEPNLVVYRVGQLSESDMQEVDARLAAALALTVAVSD